MNYSPARTPVCVRGEHDMTQPAARLADTALVKSFRGEAQVKFKQE